MFQFNSFDWSYKVVIVTKNSIHTSRLVDDKASYIVLDFIPCHWFVTIKIYHNQTVFT
jgi:hypothetical protein